MSPTKPKVHIDQDGDGAVDVTVDVDTPTTPGTWPPGVRNEINMLVGRMEVHITPPTQRVTYATVRETLRHLLANNP